MTLKELLNFEFTINEDGEMIALVPLSRVNEIADILTNQKERIDKAIEWVKKHINKYECKGITIIDWDELSNPNDLLEILGDKE